MSSMLELTDDGPYAWMNKHVDLFESMFGMHRMKPPSWRDSKMAVQCDTLRDKDQAAGSALAVLRHLRRAVIKPIINEEAGDTEHTCYSCTLYNATDAYATLIFEYDHRQRVIDICESTGKFLFQMCGDTSDWKHLRLRFGPAHSTFGGIAGSSVLDRHEKVVMHTLPRRFETRDLLAIQASRDGDVDEFAIIEEISHNQLQVHILDNFSQELRRLGLLKAAYVLSVSVRFAILRSGYFISSMYDEICSPKPSSGSGKCKTPLSSGLSCSISGAEKLNRLNDFVIKKAAEHPSDSTYIYIIGDAEDNSLHYLLKEKTGDKISREYQVVDVLEQTTIFTLSIPEFNIKLGEDVIGTVEDDTVYDQTSRPVMDITRERHHNKIWALKFKVFYHYPDFHSELDKDFLARRKLIAILNYDIIQGFVRSKILLDISAVDKALILAFAIRLSRGMFKVQRSWAPTVTTKQEVESAITYSLNSYRVANYVLNRLKTLVQFAHDPKELIDYYKLTNEPNEKHLYLLTFIKEKERLMVNDVISGSTVFRVNHMLDFFRRSSTRDLTSGKDVGYILALKFFDENDKQIMFADYGNVKQQGAMVDSFLIYSCDDAANPIAEIQFDNKRELISINLMKEIENFKVTMMITAFAIKVTHSCVPVHFSDVYDIEDVREIAYALRGDDDALEAEAYKEVNFETSQLNDVVEMRIDGVAHLRYNDSEVYTVKNLGDDKKLLRFHYSGEKRRRLEAWHMASKRRILQVKDTPDNIFNEYSKVYDEELSLMGYTQGLSIYDMNKRWTLTARIEKLPNEETHQLTVRDVEGNIIAVIAHMLSYNTLEITDESLSLIDRLLIIVLSIRLCSSTCALKTMAPWHDSINSVPS